MRVHVDESRGDRQPFRLEQVPPLQRLAVGDGSDLPVTQSQIDPEAGPAGAVDYGAVADHQVELDVVPSRAARS
ncbi:MAG: hypothetical protein P8189_30615 [Anaerolineae bacterium]